MIEFLISVWTSMSDYSFFFYPAVCGLFLAFICLFRGFFFKGDFI